MSTKIEEKTKQDILRLLEALRQDYVQGNLTLYKEHLAEDAVVLGIGDPGIRKGKESFLEYLRLSAQKGSMRKVSTELADVKLVGDVAIVSETYITQYEIKGDSFQDCGRSTSILVNKEGCWYASHFHLERLATNRVIPS